MADLPPGPARWMPRERWDALVRGEGCPLCRDLAAGTEVDAYGYAVADMRLSRLRLAANQSVPGYCVLIARRHVREPYELDRSRRRQSSQSSSRRGLASSHRSRVA